MKQVKRKTTIKEQQENNDNLLNKLFEIIKSSFEKNTSTFEKQTLEDQLKQGNAYVKLLEIIQKNLSDTQSHKESKDNFEINRLAEMIRSDSEALNLVNSLLDRIEEIQASITRLKKEC